MSEGLKPGEHVYGSQCCGATMSPIPMMKVQREPGVTSYYRHRCDGCRRPCHDKLLRLADSQGVEIRPGDVIECPALPNWHAERFHAAYLADYGNGPQLEIRDLGNNNVAMYQFGGRFLNRGQFWNHLDKLTDEDLEYYWQTTREEAERRAKQEEAG